MIFSFIILNVNSQKIDLEINCGYTLCCASQVHNVMVDQLFFPTFAYPSLICPMYVGYMGHIRVCHCIEDVSPTNDHWS